tara:strand:+ start:169 stop:348 length:180 start_codon:yes stop_codon:yes gene_type:complete
MEESSSKTNPTQDNLNLSNLDLSVLFFAIKKNLKKASLVVKSIECIRLIFALKTKSVAS